MRAESTLEISMNVTIAAFLLLFIGVATAVIPAWYMGLREKSMRSAPFRCILGFIAAWFSADAIEYFIKYAFVLDGDYSPANLRFLWDNQPRFFFPCLAVTLLLSYASYRWGKNTTCKKSS